MANVTSLLANVFSRKGRPALHTDLPRRLRAFDARSAPYADTGVVAYMQAGPLSDLTRRQIRSYLLLIEQPKSGGLAISWIAKQLKVKLNDVAADLAVLENLGYAKHIAYQQVEECVRREFGWVSNPEHWASDCEFLYGEFALL